MSPDASWARSSPTRRTAASASKAPPNTVYITCKRVTGNFLASFLESASSFFLVCAHTRTRARLIHSTKSPKPGKFAETPQSADSSTQGLYKDVVPLFFCEEARAYRASNQSPSQPVAYRSATSRRRCLFVCACWMCRQLPSAPPRLSSRTFRPPALANLTPTSRVATWRGALFLSLPNPIVGRQSRQRQIAVATRSRNITMASACLRAEKLIK